MKTKSQELAENFVSGPTFPILEEMVKEFSTSGIQENKVINKHQFASHLFGMLAGRVNKLEYLDSQGYSQMDNYLFQENNKKPYRFQKSLTKPVFIRVADEKFSAKEKEIYSHLLTIEEKECDSVKFFAGFFNELSSK